MLELRGPPVCLLPLARLPTLSPYHASLLGAAPGCGGRDGRADKRRSRGKNYQPGGLVIVPTASVRVGGSWLAASTPARIRR
jgi:hypothetical protein